MGQWRREAVTQEVLYRIDQMILESFNSVLSGSLLSDTADRVAINTAHAAGFMEALSWLQEFKGDPEEDKPEPDRGSFTWTDSQEQP